MNNFYRHTIALCFAAGVIISPASAQLFDIRWNGSVWTGSTVTSTPYTVVGPNWQANSVYAGNATTTTRWDTTNTTPTVGSTSSVGVSQIVYNEGAAGYSFGLSGSTIIRFEPDGSTTTVSSSPSWKAIGQDRGTNIVLGLTTTGQIGRTFFSSGWVSESGTALNNASTGYTSIAADGVYAPGDYIFSSGGGNGLDRTYYDGVNWIFQDVTSENYDTLTLAVDQANAVFGVNSGGLDRVYFDGGWVTQSINSTNYSKLISDREVPFVIYGLTSTGIDQIFSSDSGVTWFTQEIYSGSFLDIADNVGTADALYAVVPEPSAFALAALGLLGTFAFVRRSAQRRRSC